MALFDVKTTANPSQFFLIRVFWVLYYLFRLHSCRYNFTSSSINEKDAAKELHRESQLEGSLSLLTSTHKKFFSFFYKQYSSKIHIFNRLINDIRYDKQGSLTLFFSPFVILFFSYRTCIVFL